MTDLWLEIYSTIKKNKLRTFLTGFAVAWGIFMLIVLLGAGNGLLHAFEKQSAGLAMNSMKIYNNRTSKAYAGFQKGREILFNNKDLEITRNFKDNVISAGAIMSKSGKIIRYGEEYVNTKISGVFPNFEKIEYPKIKFGRFINQLDLNEKRKIAVLNEETAKELVPTNHKPESIIGKNIKIDDIVFKIGGIYADDGNSSDRTIYLPFTTLQHIYNETADIGNIIFSIKNLNTEKENEKFEEKYRAAIAANHQFDKTDRSAIWIWNRFTQFLQQQKGQKYLRIAIWVIGIFTLLSGIVGVSNIMLITVKERTREFGIRKALGASPNSILSLVIFESVLITTFFGYLGLVCGVLATEYLNIVAGSKVVEIGSGMSFTTFLNPTVDITVALQATLTLIIAGTLAGFFPAKKAVSIKPIEALRAE